MRIDDDSAERAQQEARAQAKKLQQQKTQQRTEQESAFDKAMSSRAQEGRAAQGHAQAQRQAAKSAIQSLLDARPETAPEGLADELAPFGELDDAPLDNAREQGRLEDARAGSAHQSESALAQAQAQTSTAGRQKAFGTASQKQAQGKQAGEQASAGQGARTQHTQAQADAQATARRSGSDADSQLQAGRDERPGQPGSGGRAKSGTGLADDQRVSARGEQGQGQQQGGQQNAQPPAFRLPPAALMAPPPVAVPKGDTQVSRLRQLAQEISEKIVKHARVGTNRMGLPEFQIELKSDILKGLKVKVSGRHGRIRASFSSRDPAVLRQLRGEVDGLRAALTARGLKVDALDIEEERS